MILLNVNQDNNYRQTKTHLETYYPLFCLYENIKKKNLILSIFPINCSNFFLVSMCELLNINKIILNRQTYILSLISKWFNVPYIRDEGFHFIVIVVVIITIIILFVIIILFFWRLIVILLLLCLYTYTHTYKHTTYIHTYTNTTVIIITIMTTTISPSNINWCWFRKRLSISVEKSSNEEVIGKCSK